MSWEQAGPTLHPTPPASVCAWMSSVPWVWARSSSSSGMTCSSLGWEPATHIQTCVGIHFICGSAYDTQRALFVHVPASSPSVSMPLLLSPPPPLPLPLPLALPLPLPLALPLPLPLHLALPLPLPLHVPLPLPLPSPLINTACKPWLGMPTHTMCHTKILFDVG